MNLMLGDCLERMKEIPDASVDMILADPPYGTTACKWDVVIPFDAMWAELKRIVKANGAIVLFGSEPFSSVLRVSNLKMFKYDWIWQKSKPVGFPNAKKMPLKDIETISVFCKKTTNYNPQCLIKCNRKISNSTKTKKKNNETAINGGAFKGTTFIQEYTGYPRQLLAFNVEKGLHPTQKPVALMEYLIKTYTQEGETVLDFTAGSFSTGVACVNIGRSFIGIEKDERYFNIGVNRVKERISCLGLEIEPMIDMVDY